MSLREWLIIIGALVILGVLLDGVRRMLRARRDAREFSQGMGGSDLANNPLDEDFNPELPNGGSRVIQPGVDSGEGQSQPQKRPDRPARVYKPTHPVTHRAGPVAESGEPDHPPEESPVSKPFQAVPNSDEDLSPLADAGQNSSRWEPDPGIDSGHEPEMTPEPETGFAAGPGEGHGKGTAEPRDEFSLSADERPHSSAADDDGYRVEDFAQGAKTLWHKLRSGAQSVTQSVERAMPDNPVEKGAGTGFDKRVSARSAMSGLGGYKKGSHDSEPQSGDSPSKAPLAGANRPPAQEVIVVNVHCKGEARLPGPALKRLFEGCGLEYGDLNIYHRHEEPDTRSPVQFSVANAVSPGTFRPEEMQDLQTPGISFFLSLPGPNDSMQAFDFMLETAQTVVRNLGGELRDEQRSVMTGQTIEHCRQRIREFERRRHFVRQ